VITVSAAAMDNLFLSVGALKAGTTWMYQVLAQHPEIYFTPEKEIHYFAHAYVPGEKHLNPQARLRRAEETAAIDPERNHPAGVRARLLWTANYLSDPVDDLWYENLFSFRRRQTWCADFSNLYAHIPPEGWSRILGRFDRLRVIYTMREPVERFWSHLKFHMQVIGKAHEIADVTPEWTWEFLNKPFIWKHGEYGEVVRRLSACLPPEALRIYFYEDVRADPLAWLRDVEDFLGIPPHAYPTEDIGKRVNPSVERSMPEWFPALLAPETERIKRELEEAGRPVPASWEGEVAFAGVGK
jgi:hypothetical protein